MSGVRCTNRKIRFLALSLSCLVFATGCGKERYDLPFVTNSDIGAISSGSVHKEVYENTFAQGLCVVTGDITDNTTVDTSRDGSVGLFCLDDHSVIYAKNIHERRNPASLTKVMTALVALKNGNPEQKITAGENCIIREKGATLCDVKPGDSMTLEQALYLMLLNSGNDVAMMIAENIGGTPEHFYEMMNEEALKLGATNTHFVNPHGLTAEDHYTTAYDLYLILNEAIKQEKFVEIIQTPLYDVTGTDASGNSKSFPQGKNTNQYVRGDRKAPESITVIGGKTGTTTAAGHCLMLYVQDADQHDYISVILKSESGDSLYEDMTGLLSEINN